MNTDKAYRSNTDNYQRVRINIEVAERLCETLDALLPTGWTSGFQTTDAHGAGWNGLILSNGTPQDHPVENFKYVCDMVTEATDGGVVNRKPWFAGEKLACLYGSLMYVHKHGTLLIEVRQMRTENCPIQVDVKDESMMTLKYTGEELG